MPNAAWSTGPCRTQEEAVQKLLAWLAEKEKSSVVIEDYKISMLVGRSAVWKGSFWEFQYDPDAKPPTHLQRDANDPLPLP